MTSRARGLSAISFVAFAVIVAALSSVLLLHCESEAFTINVKTQGPNGTLVPIQAGFRYLIEEDNSLFTTPGVGTPVAPWPDPSNTLAVNIHKSHAPVVCAGDTGAIGGSASVNTATNPDCNINPAKRYMVSVVPWHLNPLFYPANQPNGPWFSNQQGYVMSGRNVAPGQQTVDIIVHSFPVPTAQITVLVFKDTQPINGAYDQPAEQGLGGFSIQLSDPIGKVMQDAWGNPVGTTYQMVREGVCTGVGGYCKPIKNPNGTYQFILNAATGVPMVDYTGNGTLTSCPSGNAAYDAANCVDLDSGAALTPGEAVVRFLAPNRYSIEIQPPASDPNWILTATLEGTRANDAWVRAGEPRFNITLGQLNWLVFYGFVKSKPMTLPSPSGVYGSITGQVVFAHDMHPPLAPGLSAGLPVPDCYVGLNNLSGADEQVYTAPCNADSTFTISNIPPGLYQLVMWDKEINAVIDFRNITIPSTGGAINLGKVPVYRWFGTLIGSVFADTNGNGYMDASEVGIPQQVVNVRFTDGSLYATQPTDPLGNYNFSQVFPWWRWIVVEIDSARMKSTGITAVADDGGSISGFGNPYGQYGINAQIQPDGKPYRTQLSAPGDEVLTQTTLLFSDMTNMINWGRGNYGPTENGGIRGFISYATSRTQEDPEKARWQSWEPGVPRVRVNLYRAVQDVNGKWVISGGIIQSAFTDSWDDNNPTGCVGKNGTPWANPQIVNGIPIRNCAETFRTWDQVRPGVFDGAYAFSSYCTGTVTAVYPNVACSVPATQGLPPGNYIVEAVPPTGYHILKWGDRNIEFGEPNAPAMLPPPCVGPQYPVPAFHQMFPDWQVTTQYPAPGQWYCGGTVDPFGFCTPSSAGPMAPSCTMKYTDVAQGKNSIVDFRMFTDVPKSSRIWGWVSDDLHLESNPNSPNASSNFAPSWLPVAIKDWSGVEIARFYTDQWGKFNGLIPSTYTIFTPNPLGMSAGIYTIAPNDPGPIIDTTPGSPTFGQFITDPWFNRAYGQEVIRENWDFYAGTTTFVDTIVIPISAFIENRIPLNCDLVDYTPEIAWVNYNGRGPIVPQGGGYTITIQSVGQLAVPNPDFNPSLPPTPPASCQTDPPPAGSNCSLIIRDHSFGPQDASSMVTVGGTPLTIVGWSPNTITATVPASATTGQLTVTRSKPGSPGSLLFSVVGVTLHVDSSSPVVLVSPPPANCDPYADATQCRRIQPAIDAAPNGAIVSIGPGGYMENVIMYKPVKLQGWGAFSTILDGTAALGNFPGKSAWNTQFQALLGGNCTSAPCIDLPTGQNNFLFEQGAIILVSACDPTQHGGTCFNQFTQATNPRIDGLGVTGATESGGGVYVNSFAPYLQITNNEIYGNQGSLSGGIRVGTSSLVNGTVYTSSHNENIKIMHNYLGQNGSLASGGGGISLFKGADNYAVTDNMICGNFSIQYGGGICHFGLSPNGLIANNLIVSNESFDEGGGIMIAGELVPAGSPANALTEGAGSVTVNANLIQGNKAGDDGGGIRTLMTNGQDVVNNPGNPALWYSFDIFNNMIVDNSSADHGGGLSFDDSVFLYVVNNTVARNDSTSTGSGAFGGPCVEGDPAGQVCPPPGEAVGGLVNSIPRVGGIAGYAYSTGLRAALAGTSVSASLKTFTNPSLYNNIIYQNRTFWWDAAYCSNFGGLRPDVQGLCGAAEAPVYWDTAVYGAPPNTLFSPRFSDLTNNATNNPRYSGNGNVFLDPLFVRSYFNRYQATSKGAAFGNLVTVTFTPNGLMNSSGVLYGDYHLTSASPVIDKGSNFYMAQFPLLAKDFDGQTRPNGAGIDIGADEYYGSAGPATYSISGRVATSGGTSVPGVTMTLSGAAGAVTTTDANGNYTFAGLVNGNYTVTPSLAGYTFSPVNRAVTISGANSTGQNFTATAGGVTYSISGTVTTFSGFGVVPLAGVTMTLSGAAGAVTTTDANGNYTFSGIVNGNYTVTPSLAGYTFSPANRAVTVSGANITGQNFTATLSGGVTYSISGTVRTQGSGFFPGNPVPGVTITLSGAGAGAVVTDANGNFTFNGLVNGNYTLTPSLTGATFSPASIAVIINNANITGLLFTRM